MRRGLKTLIVAAILLAPCVVGSRAQPASEDAREIARHGAWVVMAASPGGQLTCFATTQPKSSQPAATQREQPYLYISAWPREGVKAEVSVAGGFAYRKGSTVTLTIGASNFALFTAGDRAFVADPTAELKLIDAMKKGSSLQVKSLDERGTITTDTYSLAGLTPTLAALTQGCGGR